MSSHPPRYPLTIDDQRAFADDFAGPVHLWDIDKTYLSTHFSSLKGLARIPVEFAVDKRAITGMPEVLRGLRRGAGAGFACVPIYFVSASPPQLRGVLERKMLLDGVEHDGIVFKDWLTALRTWTPWRLRQQIGFKLCALLTARQRRPLSVEYLYGDDTEQDAAAYSLYARLTAGELSPAAAESEMEQRGVHPLDRRIVHQLLGTLPQRRGNVARIFIHLEQRTRPEEIAAAGPLVMPTRDGVQLAVATFALGLLPAGTVAQAIEAMRSRDPAYDLAPVLDDARRRGLASDAVLAELHGAGVLRSGRG
jgi:hypothetical protein